MLFIIVLIIISIMLLLFYIPGVSVAPYVPTKKNDVKRMVSLAEIQKGDIVYDLGCGDGRLLIEADKYTTNLIGVEVSPLVYVWCRVNLFLHNVKAKIILYNLLNINLEKADVIFFFLMPQVIPKVHQKILKECKKGCKIITYCFKIPGLKEKKVIWPKDKLPIYSYIIE